MALRSEPCAVCAEFLQPYTVIHRGVTIYPNDQSFENFRATARTCFICHLIWNATEEHSVAWEKQKFKGLDGVFFTVRNVYEETHGPAPYEVLIDVTFPNPFCIGIDGIEIGMYRADLDGNDPSKSARHPNTLFSPISTETFSTSTSSEFTLDLAKFWYQECSEDHAGCGPTVPRRIPNRLLDVGQHGQTEWKLVIPAEDFSPHVGYPPYMTLSYRWGPQPRLLLLLETVLRFRSGQAIEDMPQTFQDLIKVAHHFGIRYVWIDCLCIIQDSVEDWVREAALMAEVYSHSACNVAAVDGSSPEDGLFRNRDPERLRHRTMASTANSSEPRDYYVSRMGYFERQLDPGTLMQRGWVLQEWFLAPNVLYFASNQVLWECSRELKCEAFPYGIPREHQSKVSPYGLNAGERQINQDQGLLTADEADTWNRLIGRYSRCDLTQPSDKLAAFAGIAELFLGVSGDVYLAGMWKSRILHDLAWAVAYPPRCTPACGYRAPSWSWAAVDGPIHIESPKPDSEIKYCVQLVDAQVKTVGKSTTVGVTGGSLTLTGKVITCRYKTFRESSIILFTDEIPTSAMEMMSYWVDTLEDQLPEVGEVHILPFRNEKYPNWRGNPDIFGFTTSTTGILLQPIDDRREAHIYRRIGLVQNTDCSSEVIFRSAVSEGKTKQIHII